MDSETRRDFLWIFAAAVVFFVSSLLLANISVYNSPDETANVFFAQTFADHGRLYAFEPLNVVLDDALFPRSTVAMDGRILPGSFLGLPVLYGLLMRVVGAAALPMLTPLVAAFAAFAWYGVVRVVFDRGVARVSALVLLVHPAWWYYAARGLMHNVLFASLLIVAAWIAVSKPFTRLRQKRLLLPDGLDACMAGLFVGLALFVRTSEAAWIGLAVLLMLFWQMRTVRLAPVALFVCSAVLALTPMAFLNRSLYGAAFTTGYTVRDESEMAVMLSDANTPEGTVEDIASRLAPFGIHPRDAWQRISAYGIGLFWWLSALAALGVPLAFPTRADRGERRRLRFGYLSSFFLVTAWLGLVYGSWSIHDNPDTSAVTIGNSYVRYWLPVFVMSTPFAALSIRFLCERPLTRVAKRLSSAAVMVLLLGLGVRGAFFASEDALVPMRDRLLAYQATKERMLAITEPDAVVIVDRADKLFFPDRRVLYPLRAENDATYDLMPLIVHRAPLYYFGITLPAQDVEYLNARKLKERGLSIAYLETFGKESLYRISQSP